MAAKLKNVHFTPLYDTDRIGNLLFDKAKIEEVKILLGSLWRERTILLLMIQRRGGQG